MPRLFPHPILLAITLAALTGCGEKSAGGGTKLPPLAGRPSRPPAAALEGLHWIKLELKDGRFGAGEKIELPFKPGPDCQLTPTPTGFRLAVADPASRGNLGEPGWGVWLFADGRIEEDQVLVCRTGTQITLDHVPLAPAEDKTKLPTSGPHALQAKLTIDAVDSERGYFEATLAGSFLPPDGRDAVRVSGTLRLPLIRK